MSNAVLRERQKALWQEWRASGSDRARTDLVASLESLVHKIAKRHRASGLPYEDIVGEARIGAIEAVEVFNPEAGNLSSIAWPYMVRRIQEYLHTMDSPVSRPKGGRERSIRMNLSRKVEACESLGMSRDEALAVVSEDFKTDADHLKSSLALKGYVPIAPAGEDEQTFDPAVEARDATDDMMCERRKEALSGAIDLLDDREKQIILARDLVDDEDQDEIPEIARKIGISETWARVTRKRALDKMRHHLKKCGLGFEDLL